MSASGGLQASKTGLTEMLSQSAVVANAVIGLAFGGTAGKTSYLCGFGITGLGATAAGFVQVAFGWAGGSMEYTLAVPAGAGVPITPLIVEFSRPIWGGGVGTGITMNVPAFGAGNTNAVAYMHGFECTDNLT